MGGEREEVVEYLLTIAALYIAHSSVLGSPDLAMSVIRKKYKMSTYSSSSVDHVAMSQRRGKVLAKLR